MGAAHPLRNKWRNIPSPPVAYFASMEVNVADDREKSWLQQDLSKDEADKKEEKAKKAPDTPVIERERDTLPLEGE